MSLPFALLIAALPPSILQGAGSSGPPLEGPTIRLVGEGFEVSGLALATTRALESADPVPPELFTVSVLGADLPMLGRVRAVGGGLRFEPRYRPRPGTTYRAAFRPALVPGADPDAFPVEAELTIPDPAPAEPARVVAAYPSADVLPENLLRFYLHFSAPMSRGEAYRRIRLVGPDGRAIEAAFLELDEELWDPLGTRLTVLIDPGRIKRGLVPRAELGPVLEPGQRYTLEVDAGWPDAAGRPLASPFRKGFRTGPPDESPPDPGSWALDPPGPGTRDPLVVRFPEPLDHALVGRLLSVTDGDGAPVVGAAEVIEGETAWSFVPDAPWTPGRYRLDAGTDLEDLAGNGIGRPFEVDVFDRVEPRVEAAHVARPFRIGPG
ncbi:Ig-like domain-containing protein [Tautonia plasticadhaerens]|uniref:Ig-like domain-containing protein n=1 Tax=Tautonia plasticadhaerens TaxID=2527974 RepID=UPI00119E6343|nr:Ig-like domain-containing protein [Tautonia plasticadhaerens]